MNESFSINAFELQLKNGEHISGTVAWNFFSEDIRSYANRFDVIDRVLNANSREIQELYRLIIEAQQKLDENDIIYMKWEVLRLNILNAITQKKSSKIAEAIEQAFDPKNKPEEAKGLISRLINWTREKFRLGLKKRS